MNNRYFLFLSLVTVVLMIAFRLSETFLAPFTINATWWLLPLLFGTISAAGHSLMIRSVKVASDQFMIWFLLAISLKMLLYLGILLIWFVISGKTIEIPFVTAFAANYVLVTVLDLATVLRINKHSSGQGKSI